MASYLLQLSILLVFVALLGTEACFIRNCPPGGKRSLPLLDHESRKCMSCGPESAGQCVGPSICCGTDFGCFFGTQEAEVCQQENDSRTPCELKGSPCGADLQGKCAADGICCDSEACAFNSRCKSSRKSLKPRLMALIQRIIQEKEDD